MSLLNEVREAIGTTEQAKTRETPRPHHSERVKRLSVILPPEVADEISDLPTCAKARLMVEFGEEVLDRVEKYPALLLSATSTQWLKSLTLRQQLQFIENLAQQLLNEIK